ncbi:unnamed protein product [Durusdinium trenchii]|uniref:Uncharacterized protein n=2 Tax=Durusdinium trenchii TaxID=1381693 RepID=A0ABP0IPJ9_9DINO
MRRVYPQVLQSEQTVQELRSEIEEVEVQAQESHTELNERTREIQDLRSSLGSVERRKAVRKDAISISRAKSRRFEEEMEATRLDQDRLSEQLQSYLHENVVDENLLARAAEERRHVLEETKRNELVVQKSMQRSGGIQLQCLGTNADLEKVDLENDSLEDELSGAEFHSSRQRLYLAMEETEASTQFHNTCEAKAANVQSHRQVDNLEETRHSLEKRLRELVDAMHEGDSLAVELAKAGEHGTSLQFYLSEMYNMVRERGEVLEGVCSSHAELRQTLEESEQQACLAQEEAKQLSSDRDVAHARCQEEQTEFATAEAKMFHAESQLESEHAEADTHLQHAKGQRATASERVDRMTENTNNLKGQLQSLQDETKHLQSRIAFFESDTSDLKAQNENLEQTIEETKKKMNCVIS